MLIDIVIKEVERLASARMAGNVPVGTVDRDDHGDELRDQPPWQHLTAFAIDIRVVVGHLGVSGWKYAAEGAPCERSSTR